MTALSESEAATSLTDPEFTPISPPARPPGTPGPARVRPVDRNLPFEINENGCFVLTRYLRPNGYGALHFYGSNTLAHRAVWLDTVGQVPAGMQLDHLCRNRACINPDHLEVVTPRENVLRSEGLSAIKARRTHCARGHLFTPETTGRKRDGSRICRTCKPARVAASDRPHGTSTHYRSGCRCEVCRTANSVRQFNQRYRDRKPTRYVRSLAFPTAPEAGAQ